jgi:ABC-2 type transport system ATP-binding protein
MTRDDSPAVELRGVSKRYGDFQAVQPLDLVVPRGATYGLLGPNGAGKTTTIRMMLRILETDTGSVRILGEPLSQTGLDRIGYLPEERGVYRRMRVRSMLSFLAELKGVPPRVSASRIAGWLERFELAQWSNARLQELSKGMQQKVQFIGTILHEPDIVILDEPFSGLDPINQQVLRDIIVQLRREGRTILFSTHIIEHAERICDHVCIIAKGSKVADGAIPDVKRRHGSESVLLRFEAWTPAVEAALRHPTVRHAQARGAGAEVVLADDADPQTLLAHMVASGIRVRRFECAEPTLERIFLERVGAIDADAIDREALHV